jgi:hypothetical protein
MQAFTVHVETTLKSTLAPIPSSLALYFLDICR